MEFYSTPGSRLGLRGIPPLLASLMRQIPRLFEQDWSVAEERLFPSPTHDSREQGLREDWKAHVEPELHAFFLSARQVVEADLRGFQESEGTLYSRIPRGPRRVMAERSEPGAPVLGGAASVGRSGPLADRADRCCLGKGLGQTSNPTSMQLFSSGWSKFWTPRDAGFECANSDCKEQTDEDSN